MFLKVLILYLRIKKYSLNTYTMSKKISVSNRINITLALLAVFLLVLGTNRVDKLHFDTVQNALTTVYKDRVMAQDYLFKMSNIVYEKKLNLSTYPETSAEVSTNFKDILALYYKTELTAKESKFINEVKNLYQDYEAQEQAYKKFKAKNASAVPSAAIIQTLDNLQLNLSELSQIQVTESRKMTGLAQKSLDSNNMLANMEIWFLLIVGIAAQFAIFYNVIKFNKKVKA